MLSKKEKEEQQRLQNLVERMDRRYAADQKTLTLSSRRIELLEDVLRTFGYDDDKLDTIRLKALKDCEE